MRKKILALVCAMVMVMAMGMTAAAAGSVSADDVDVPSVPAADLATGSQQFDTTTVEEFATTTTVKAGNATVSVASMETVADAIAEAKAVVNANAFVAAVVELNGTAGTYTLGCPNVWAGQKVYVLHQLSNGSWEKIVPDSVANNSVTFTVKSLSPIALVVDTTASKTADMAGVVALMALVSLAGCVVCAKKAN